MDPATEAALVHGGFSLIGAILKYLSEAGVSEEVIEANWQTKMSEFYARPSEELKDV